jgi:hypothetical protein
VLAIELGFGTASANPSAVVDHLKTYLFELAAD